MQITQVSAFLENRPGRLLRLLNVLAEADVNLIAHNIVDASDFGIVHFITDDPARTAAAVRAAGVTCSTTTVLDVAVPNQPGGFVNYVLKPLAEAGVNIEYSYAFSVASADCARIVLKVDDAQRGETALSQAACQ
jgi:hypothetical protein